MKKWDIKSNACQLSELGRVAPSGNVTAEEFSKTRSIFKNPEEHRQPSLEANCSTLCAFHFKEIAPHKTIFCCRLQKKKSYAIGFQLMRTILTLDVGENVPYEFCHISRKSENLLKIFLTLYFAQDRALLFKSLHKADVLVRPSYPMKSRELWPGSLFWTCGAGRLSGEKQGTMGSEHFPLLRTAFETQTKPSVVKPEQKRLLI